MNLHVGLKGQEPDPPSVSKVLVLRLNYNSMRHRRNWAKAIWAPLYLATQPIIIPKYKLKTKALAYIDCKKNS